MARGNDGRLAALVELGVDGPMRALRLDEDGEDPDGELGYAATLHSETNGFALDPIGNVLLTGMFEGNLDFGTGVLVAGSPEAPWAKSIFVAKVAL
jgi:hypothetical protein